MIRNNPVGREQEIKDLSNSYIIRTRTDAGTIEARNLDYNLFESAYESNAQIISTDYYRPDYTISDFVIHLTNGKSPFLLKTKH